ncbi:MAG: hypothetical protein CMN53_01815 [SAR116 cluster bacterium]|nr:hypothetical protein [SAR116 cluster bacterium]
MLTFARWQRNALRRINNGALNGAFQGRNQTGLRSDTIHKTLFCAAFATGRRRGVFTTQKTR